ncbi:Ppx/GppA phosphatase family protein [Flammeovirga agarivorans]|uniref:Exopolyphosphatase n=1 Tax=Flammeovirga agarivorans TaxID=2726742 RepID=A0A7X8SNB4_9BACT|nr:exopolyphosphatase [Flammeovirga agarivorans]NLR93277.1 exopolyphosphatase [Flammeovirga agarivorans]
MAHIKASIDMGTNTFQLLIAEVENNAITNKLYAKDIFVRLGKGGISNGEIIPEAQERAFNALAEFDKVIRKHKADSVAVAATSAVRVAKNGAQFIQDIRNKFGFEVSIIQGAEEAEVIYYGVRSDVAMKTTSIIMDIGGGSVEFIICDAQQVLWKQSFEIGAQRLYDMFCKTDPMEQSAIEDLKEYVNNELQSLWEAVNTYQPKQLIGAAGTFETLQDIYGAMNSISTDQVKSITSSSYSDMYTMFIGCDEEARLKIPGLIRQRVNMIVPASSLLKTVVDQLSFDKIFISSASLREGLLLRKNK